VRCGPQATVSPLTDRQRACHTYEHTLLRGAVVDKLKCRVSVAHVKLQGSDATLGYYVGEHGRYGCGTSFEREYDVRVTSSGTPSSESDRFMGHRVLADHQKVTVGATCHPVR